MIKNTLQADQIKALKSGDKKRLETLRYILAQIKNKEIDKKEALTDDEVTAVLRKQMKELKESIEAFEKGNRMDLANEYKLQQEILASYMPAEISDAELKQEIEKIIKNNEAVYQKSPKAIIGICMRELKTKAEPARIIKTLESLQ